MNFEKLRKKHPKFIYQSFDWKHQIKDDGSGSLLINFKFEIETLNEPGIVFAPAIKISPVLKKQIEKVPKQLLETWIFNLGMIELFSYWKTTASPIIEVRAGVRSDQNIPLNKKQLAWWKDLLLKGMGEYFYTNKIDFTKKSFVEWTVKSGEKITQKNEKLAPSTSTSLKTQRYLVPIGGGKDSALVLGILDKHNLEYDVLLSEPQSPAAKKIVAASGSKNIKSDTITIKRKFDPKLFELNKQGYLNGHTPFSARLAFTSSLVALLHGHQKILLANELSANEGNVDFHGVVVNHQYSKSFEFETKFRKYVQKYLTEKNSASPEYLSFLRPIHEIQIAKLFTQYPKYHEIFKSCNVGQQSETWCYACPKCLFVFAIMYPFIEESRLVGEIFPKNLLEDPAMVQNARELLGLEETKPFECVGTHDEVMLAFLMSKAKFEINYPNKELPIVLKSLRADLNKYSPKDVEKLKQKILLGWNKENWLDNQLREILTEELDIEVVKPELEKSPIIILGLGREGYSTYEFLRKKFPNKKLYGADSHPQSKLDKHWNDAVTNDSKLTLFLGKKYLEKTLELQRKEKQKIIIFKTPGITKSIPEIQTLLANGAILHSNTQLFFELSPALIIGITGTKGKSTTASVIHHVLDKNGVKTILVGNIGHPALDAFKQPNSLTKDTIVVFELSSHQLESLPYSPRIAVVQNVTSEHLDYYSTTSEYQAAKFSITQHQDSDDLVIYDPKFESSNKIAMLSPGKHLRHSLEEGPDSIVFLRGNKIMYRDPKNHVVEIIDRINLSLPGEHNLRNVMPAIVVGSLFGLKPEEIGKTLSSFVSLPHRLEFVTEIDDVKYFDDSLATNPRATIKAIESFDEPMVLIAGGYERDQDFSKLAKTILENNVVGVVLFETEPGKRLVKELKKLSSRAINKFAKSMKEAVKLASEIIPPGGIVLMSPAAASFGMFKDYKDRGEQFKKAVKKLGK